jgi:hypothetical protein
MKKLYPLPIASPSSISDRAVRSHEWGWRGRSLFLVCKGISPFTTFSRAAGDRTFCIERAIALYDFSRRAIALFGIVPVDRPLLLFLREGPSLFLVSCRSIALYCFFSGKGDRFSGVGGDRFLG